MKYYFFLYAEYEFYDKNQDHNKGTLDGIIDANMKFNDYDILKKELTCKIEKDIGYSIKNLIIKNLNFLYEI